MGRKFATNSVCAVLGLGAIAFCLFCFLTSGLRQSVTLSHIRIIDECSTKDCILSEDVTLPEDHISPEDERLPMFEGSSEDKASYDALINFILHPRARCKSMIVLGGQLIGNKLDGDKIVCLDPGRKIMPECLVYSFGIGYDWSFEEEVREKFKCNVFAFDPSTGKDDHQHSEGIWFFNTGIGSFDGTVRVKGQVWEVKRFSSIVKDLGPQDQRIDILKMDIEGDEFDALSDILDEGLMKSINHLCVEIHLPNVGSFESWDQVHRILKRITEENGLHHFSTRNNSFVPPARVPGFLNRREHRLFELAWYRI